MHGSRSIGWPALVLLTAVSFPPELTAQQSLEGRIVGHVLPEGVTVVDVGDVPGHTVTLVQARGLAFLDDGQVAELSATETLDHVDGGGTYRAYEILPFESGIQDRICIA